MSTVFVLLFLAATIALIWGLIAPHHIAKAVRVRRTVTRKHTGLIFGCLVLLFFILTGITAPAQPSKTKTVSFQPSGYTHATQTASAPKQATTSVTTKQETETKAVAFATQTQNDGSLTKGQTKILQTGVNGTETLTYTTTYTNGKQSAKTLVSDTITTAATPEIVAVGTYVAPTPGPAPQPAPNPVPTPVPTPAPASCYPLTNGGNCYEPGEYCRNTDHGVTGTAGNGEAIQCLDNNGWRWEPR